MECFLQAVSQKHPQTNKVLIHAANVGDARAVLSCTKKSRSDKALRLTRDHRAEDPEEIARIEAAGGFVLKNRVLGTSC